MHTKKMPIQKGVDTLLGSLALLRINILPNDHISSFIPLLATLFIEENIYQVDIDSLISTFSTKYGFVIPRMPMLAILKNCSKQGIITRKADGRFYVQRQVATNHCFSDQARRQSRKYDQIIAEFREYVYTTQQMTLTNEQAEQIFLSFLTENSCKTLTLHLSDFEMPETLSAKSSILIAKFVQYCATNASTTFNLIQDIASAHLIASAMVSEIKEEIDNSNIHCRYNSLVLYLDTPIILRVLGLNTDEMQVSYEALLQELSSRNNVFKVFQHTFNEIQGILSDCIKWIDNPLYNARYASQALRTFIAKKYNKGDIAIFIETLDRKLKEYGIEIDETDYYSHTYNYLQIDETPIRQAIISTYTENTPNFNAYAKEYTIECDVKSISAIYKLRRKKVYRTYAQAKYLFVTNNTTLAYISRKFTDDQNPSFSYRIYPGITDVLLGTAIWLSAPVEKIDTFSRKKLLADCSAAIMPSEPLVSCLSESIERMYQQEKICKEDYYLLKIHAFNNYYLADKTLNDETAFSDKITEEILEDIKAEIAAPYIQQIKEKDEAIRSTEDRAKQLADEKEKAEQEKALRNQDAKGQAKIRVKRLEIAMIPILVAFVALFVVLVTNILTPPPKLNIALNLFSALFAVLAACLLAALYYDACSICSKLENYWKNKYLIKLYKKDLK